MNSLRKIQFRTSIYQNITGVMKSCVSVMNLITAVIKKFITEGVNSCQMKGRFFGCHAVQLSSSPFLKTLVFTTSEHALFDFGHAQWLISRSNSHSPPQSKPISGCDT